MVEYSGIDPEGNPFTVKSGRKNVNFATFGYKHWDHDDKPKCWIQMGVSTATDALKAAKNSRSTNPYFGEYRAVPITPTGN
jgi:hypothetical protein